MSSPINSSLIPSKFSLSKSDTNNIAVSQKEQKEALPSTTTSSSKVDISEKAQMLASATLDTSEIGKLLTITTPSLNKETIKPSKTGLDAYLALNKNKLY